MKKKIILISALLLTASGLSAAGTGSCLPPDTSAISNNQKDYHVNISIDPVGFITLGPSINVEPAIGKNIGINTGLRLHNLGLIASSLYGSMKMSYLIHFSIKYYIKPSQKIDGFFLGPGLEYGRSNYTSGSKYNVRAFGGGLGYKWVFAKGFSLELSDYIGIVQSKSIDVDYVDDWSTDMFVFYLLSVRIGKVF